METSAMPRGQQRGTDCQLTAEIFETFSPLENCSLVPALVPACRRNLCYWKLSCATMGHARERAPTAAQAGGKCSPQPCTNVVATLFYKVNHVI